ncbi:MAG TPA: PKD domain-containing protein [Chitinophagaceae bacterium]|nr:PKD domain-containing protein [Chitinophagaceae bacterium]
MKTFLLVFLGALALSSSCHKGDNTSDNKPSAKFSISGYEKPTPCTITFINISTNSASYLWDFGDGNTSTQFNPTHTYNFNGSFLLKLKVTGPGGVDSVCKLVAIEPPPPSNRSAFSYFQEKCASPPFGISFKTVNPLSTNPVWDFGSGPTILSPDPIIQFLIPGDYTIKYSTMLSGVRDTLIRIIRID